MTIEEMQKEAHATATEKGFWEGKDPIQNLPQAIALIHSEVSEAFEELRKPGLDPRHVYFTKDGEQVEGWQSCPLNLGMVEIAKKGYKPEGMAVEFADAVIRMLDNCEKLGIPLKTAILVKMAYNKTRPHKHGKNF